MAASPTFIFISFGLNKLTLLTQSRPRFARIRRLAFGQRRVHPRQRARFPVVPLPRRHFANLANATFEFGGPGILFFLAGVVVFAQLPACAPCCLDAFDVILPPARQHRVGLLTAAVDFTYSRLEAFTGNQCEQLVEAGGVTLGERIFGVAIEPGEMGEEQPRVEASAGACQLTAKPHALLYPFQGEASEHLLVVIERKHHRGVPAAGESVVPPPGEIGGLRSCSCRPAGGAHIADLRKMVKETNLSRRGKAVDPGSGRQGARYRQSIMPHVHDPHLQSARKSESRLLCAFARVGKCSMARTDARDASPSLAQQAPLARLASPARWRKQNATIAVGRQGLCELNAHVIFP